MVLISMALGSLVECRLEENEERGRPCPSLRAIMQGFFHPSFEGDGNFFHGVDHGSELYI